MRFITRLICCIGIVLVLLLYGCIYGLNTYLLAQGYYIHLFACLLIELSLYWTTLIWFLGSALFCTVGLIHALLIRYSRRQTNVEKFAHEIVKSMTEEECK